MRLLERVLPAAESERPALPDYALLRLIGRGSYGDVWIARSVTGAYRAVKIVWRSRFEDPQPYEREFKGLTEFAAISLEESRQLALLHVSRTPDFFYYVMELADDRERGRDIDPETYQPRTLKDVVVSGQPLPVADVLRLAIDLTQALSGLHARGLVHRDIKPSNVIFVSHVPKLADIGLVATASAGLTFVGTEGYVPPEGPGAPAADVYSLGKVLYELATGLGRNDYPRLPADLHTRADRKALLELNEIIIRACAPHPEDRYRDAGALLEELQLLQAGKSVRRLRLAERRLGRALRLAAALAVFATIAGVGAWLENKRAAKAEAERDALRQRTEYIAKISQARIALEGHDYGTARQLLAAARPTPDHQDLRGVEWHLLSKQAQGTPASRIVSDLGDSISSIFSSPDRSTYAVHLDSGAVTIYRTADHSKLRTIENVHSFAGYSIDGQWLLGASGADRWIPQRWRLSDGSPEVAPSNAPSLRAIAVSQEGHLVGLASTRNSTSAESPAVSRPELLVWNYTNRSVERKISVTDPTDQRHWEFFRAGVSRVGNTIAIALLSGRQKSLEFAVAIADLERGAAATVPMPSLVPRAVIVSEQSGHTEVLIIDDASRCSMALRNEAGKWMATEKQSTTLTGIVDWPATRRRLAIHSAAIELVDQTEPSQWFRGHKAGISAVAPLTQDTFATGSTAGELRVWSVSDAPNIIAARPVWDSRARNTGLVFSPSGDVLYTPVTESTTGALTTKGLTLATIIPGIRIPIACDKTTLWGITPNARQIAAWSLAGGRVTWTTPESEVQITSAAISGDRQRLAYLGADGVLVTNQIGGGSSTAAQKIPKESWSLTLNHHGDRAWTVDNSPSVRCMNIEQQQISWSVKLPSVAAHLHFIKAQNLLVMPLQNREIQLRDATSGVLIRTITSSSSPTEFLTSTSKPFRLIAAGRDNAVSIIDPEFGLTLASTQSSDGESAHLVALSADEQTLAVITKRGLLRLEPLRF